MTEDRKQEQENLKGNYRQFWIYGFNSGKTQISKTEVSFDSQFFSPGDSRSLKPQFIHKVIEFSAYERLQQENEDLNRKLEVAKEALAFFCLEHERFTVKIGNRIIDSQEVLDDAMKEILGD